MRDNILKALLFAGRFEVRGSCGYTLRLADYLDDYQVAVNVVCPDARTVKPHRREELRIDEYRHIDAPVWGRFVMEMLRKDVSLEMPDIIHLQSRSMLGKGQWLAQRLKRPCVLTVHDHLRKGERVNLDCEWCRRIIAVSDSVKADLLARTSLPEEMVTVIPSGVEVTAPGAKPEVLAAGHVPVVGTAGPLEAVKGFPFFLGAAQRVLATHPEVQFLVAGAGPEETNLRRLARDLGITHSVTFVPNLYDFSESLAATDIFCLPSLQQGLGTIMLEAMAMGRPVIATKVGGVYSVVRDNATGLLVPPSDSGRLAERIVELLDDPERARTIGAAARDEVQQGFAVDRMVRLTAALYRDVVAEFAELPRQPATS